MLCGKECSRFAFKGREGLSVVRKRKQRVENLYIISWHILF